MDMGIKPFVIAPAINLVIAQRLVRKVCSECAETYTPEASEREVLREELAGVVPEVFDAKRLDAADLQLLRAKGCAACMAGYKGRIGLFEIFAVRDELEQLILEGADGYRIKEAALKQGMTTIVQDGYLKALDKVTTIEEVKRVTEA